jgi:hypothetical protein
MNKPPVNLTPLQRDYAIYLPAISSFYGTYIAKQRLEKFIPDDRMPVGFDRGVEGMNFLNEEQGYFTYKYGLYSAGHATLDLNKTMTKESMIQQRDRSKTMILGDSGGFQIGKGVLKFDWLNFEGPSATKTRQSILEWLEVTADWSMMLDVPTWACDHNHTTKTGLKTFEDCLDKTRFNNEYFLKNRLGQTKFLNVLQGGDWERAEQWYQGVKEYSDPAVWEDKAAEGWAMGGANMSMMDVTLKRLMTLREDGLLEGKNWMHFLGTAQLDWACFLTSIQRQIRKHINEDFTISFDCASPFIATAHGLVYTNPQHSPKRWSTIMQKATDTKTLAGSEIPFPFTSEIASRLTMGDICYYKHGIPNMSEVNRKNIDIEKLYKEPKLVNDKTLWEVMGDKNKIGKVGSTSWDSFSYALMMAHNVNSHITSVQTANHLMDVECAKYKPDWRAWKKVKDKDKSDEYSEWVPRNILYFDRFVEELFNTKTKDEAFAMIEEGITFLRDLEGTRSQDGMARNTYFNLFEFEVTDQNEIDLSNPDDDALRALEEDIDE